MFSDIVEIQGQNEMLLKKSDRKEETRSDTETICFS